MARDLVVRYEGDTSGADAASAKTRAQLQQTAAAADQMAKQFAAAAAKSSASGARVGDGLVKGIARAVGGQALKSAGGAAGTALANAVGRQIAQTSVFKGLQAKAGIAGQQAGKTVADKLGTGLNRGATKAGTDAGKKVSTGIEKQGTKVNWSRLRTPALIAAAVGIGVLFGSRFGRSASTSAQSSFRPNFSGGGGGGVLGKALGGLKLGAVGVAAGIGTSIAGALTGAIKLGGDRLIAIDDATAKLRGLGHSAQDVQAIMGSALAAVKGTAFGLGDAATIAASSVAAGIKPGKDLERTLRDVADAATIGGSSLGDMGAIFNQVATSNKVYNDTLNQLGDRGIPIVQLLGKEMGVSAGKVTDLAAKGKIDFETFRKAMEAGLGGAALSSGNTFSGALANAKAALGRFGADLLSGAFPQLKRVFGDVTSALDTMGPTAKRIGASTGRAFADVITTVEGVAPVVGQLGGLFEGAGRIVASLFGGAAKSGVRAYTKSLTTLIDYVATHQADVISGLQAGANSALDLGQALVDAAANGLKGVGALADGVAGFVQSSTDAVGSLIHSAAAIAPLLGPAGLPITKAAADFDKAKASADGVADGLRRAGKGATDAGNALQSNLDPKIQKTRDHLNEVANQEIFKATQRDAAAKFAVAVRDVGQGASGSAIHLKKWSDVSSLSANTQKTLRSRIKAAQGALQDQIGAQQAAGAGQKALTKTWETGRDRLAAEFRQMGLSKKEAGRLADKYAGIPPKKKTQFSAPGLSDAKTKAQQLKDALNNLPRDVQISIKAILSGTDVAIDAAKKAFNSYTGGVWAGPQRGVIKAASGRVLPGFTPGRDVHRFYSATAGELDLSGGEAIMRPEWTRAVGGPTAVARINREAASGQLRANEFAAGGVPLAALPDAPSTSAPSTRSSTDSGLSRQDVDRMISAMEDMLVHVAVTPDYRGFVGLIDARIAEASRKPKGNR